jgi:cytochrome c peroxidase
LLTRWLRLGLKILVAITPAMSTVLAAHGPAAASDPHAREGAPLARLAEPPLGLPALAFPDENPPTGAKISLGRKLFFDPRLSYDDSIACGTCHVPEQGFTVNGEATAVGAGGKVLRRNAPSVVNAAYFETLFHDGRAASLEAQALDPLRAADEMGNPSLDFVVDEIKGLEDYAGFFEAAFGRGPDAETIAQAIATYERTVLSGNSPFDRWYFGDDEDAVGAQVKRGFKLFRGKAACDACHHVQKDHALFVDQMFHDTGIGFDPADPDEPPEDLGRFEVTQEARDRSRFKTPGLRNVALTAPYMHDGSLKTLREVVVFYDRGGVRHKGLDLLMFPLNLSGDEIDAVVAFLESLTGDNVAALIAEARGGQIEDESDADAPRD